MDSAIPDNEASPTSEPTPPTRRRRPNALTGAMLGVVALTASVLGVSAIAGAQDEPTTDADPAVAADLDEMDLDDGDFDDGDFDDAVYFDDFDDEEWAAFDECIDGALGPIEEPADDTDLTEAEWEALEAQFEAAEAECNDLLPEDVKAEIAAWEPFDECLDTQLESVDLDIEDEAELTDEQWAALDAQFEAAEEACVDLLPEDVKAEWAAFEAFDECLADAGFGEGDFDHGPVVHIDTGDGGQVIEFGEATGTVTITGDANGITVDSSGVTVIDEGEIDAAFEACEQLLPEDVFDMDDDFDEWDEDGEWDDEGDEDA